MKNSVRDVMYSIMYETRVIIQRGISAGFVVFSLQSHAALHNRETENISSEKSLLTSNLLHVFSKSIYLEVDLRVIYEASFTEKECFMTPSAAV